MVVLSKIYTRTGDKGETALGNGTRVAKFDVRVESYGSVDEANACFGMARLHAAAELAQQIERIQNDLFDLGADLCNPDIDKDAEAAYPPLRMTASQTGRLEAEIDAMNERLETLRSFILPGGSALSAHLHLCRTVVRRAERRCIELAAAEPVNAEAIIYLNRLSDWCFCAARLANDDGRTDVLWTPGANR
ncbi:cob(I)yrinic acid a,c-diamide adenosyltransferase [Palleronia sp.]|uniref:cob(I)yrinic acid a,c-diamide adenosyltransferase n=1 Tax=Palleronia sp. TaxID=1940284 RepID=UPI0035C7D3BA